MHPANPSTGPVFSNAIVTTKGHHNKFLQPETRTDTSFFPSAVRLWNTLPAALVSAKTIEFKNLATN